MISYLRVNQQRYCCQQKAHHKIMLVFVYLKIFHRPTQVFATLSRLDFETCAPFTDLDQKQLGVKIPQHNKYPTLEGPVLN